MGAREQLRVRVNDELVLDAGTCEEVSGPQGPERILHPPKTTLFHQVLAYLKAKPEPPKRPFGSMAGREGVAAAALTCAGARTSRSSSTATSPSGPRSARRDEPHQRRGDGPHQHRGLGGARGVGRHLPRDPGRRVYEQLVNRAVAYLPMPKKTSKIKVAEFGALAQPEVAARLVEGSLRLARREGSRRCRAPPEPRLRQCALNTAWRNGPVEDIHAGGSVATRSISGE